MTTPALLGVAHGSPDPRAEPVLEALVARVAAERPGLTTALAYLGHTQPDVPTALRSLARQGFSDVVVVPLLLTAAYHARTDLPSLLARTRAEISGLSVTQTEVLGPHPLLFSLVRRRLAEAGVDQSSSVVLGAVGTSDPSANAELADVAGTLGASIGFAAGPPTVGDAVAGMRAQGAGSVAIASYVLAPGTLPDRFHAAGADVVARPLGAEPEIVQIVLERYDAAVRRDVSCRATWSL